MLTTILFLLSLQSAPLTPASTACPRIEWPALSAPRAYETPEPLPMRECEPSRGVAALMYDVGIDAAEPAQAEELDADIYADGTP